MSWSTLQTDKKKTSRQMLKMGYTTSYMFPDTYQERHAFCQSLFSFQQCSKIYKTRKNHEIELKWRKAAVYSRFHKKLLDTYYQFISFFLKKSLKKQLYFFVCLLIWTANDITSNLLKKKKYETWRSFLVSFKRWQK